MIRQLNIATNKVCADLKQLCFVETAARAANKKINANFLFGGFIASYESWCVNEQYDLDTKMLIGGSYYSFENKKPWWKVG